MAKSRELQQPSHPSISRQGNTNFAETHCCGMKISCMPSSSTPVSYIAISSAQRFYFYLQYCHTLLKFNAQFNVL